MFSRVVQSTQNFVERYAPMVIPRKKRRREESEGDKKTMEPDKKQKRRKVDAIVDTVRADIVAFSKPFPEDVMELIFLEASLSIPLFCRTLLLLEKEAGSVKSRWARQAQLGYLYSHKFLRPYQLTDLLDILRKPPPSFIPPSGLQDHVISAYFAHACFMPDVDDLLRMSPNIDTLAVVTYALGCLMDIHWARHHHGIRLSPNPFVTDKTHDLRVSIIDELSNDWDEVVVGSERNEVFCNRITHLTFFRALPRNGLGEDDFPRLTHLAFPHVYAASVFEFETFPNLVSIVMLIPVEGTEINRTLVSRYRSRTIKLEKEIEEVLLTFAFRDRRIQVFPYASGDDCTQTIGAASYWDENFGRDRSFWNKAKKYTTEAVWKLLKTVQFGDDDRHRLLQYMSYTSNPPLPLDGILPLSITETLSIEPALEHTSGLKSFISRFSPKDLSITAPMLEELSVPLCTSDSLVKPRPQSDAP